MFAPLDSVSRTHHRASGFDRTCQSSRMLALQSK
jgi:hypothetical protein